LTTGKSRLQTDSDALRAQLALAFFLDAIAALERSTVVDRILVVSADTTIHRCVRARCDILADNETGLSSAVDMGLDQLRRMRHLGPVAVVLPDLPFATADAFDTLLGSAREYPQAYLADAAGTGTTCVTATSMDTVVHRFGPNSARAHSEAGLVALKDPVPGLRADVDVLNDLDHPQSLRLGGETTKVVLRWQARER
jgi:2-phospho-L-lactate guanylyltransferase